MENYFLIYALLTITSICGICGLFLFKDRYRKISSLAIAYASFLAFMVLFCVDSKNSSETAVIITNLAIVFVTNLFIGSKILEEESNNNAAN